MHNDIAMAIDKGHSAILVLLDLSVAFDTVDHSMLLSRLNTRFGNIVLRPRSSGCTMT